MVNRNRIRKSTRSRYMSRPNRGIVCKIIEGKYKGCRAIAYHLKQLPDITRQGKSIVTVFQDSDCFQQVAENVIISSDKLIQIGFSD